MDHIIEVDHHGGGEELAIVKSEREIKEEEWADEVVEGARLSRSA